jgi:hypothetical protein
MLELNDPRMINEDNPQVREANLRHEMRNYHEFYEERPALGKIK